jgi:hypothetical protein
MKTVEILDKVQWREQPQGQRAWFVGDGWWQTATGYETISGLLIDYPEYLNAIETLENSDLFPQLSSILQMEWRDDDIFPALQQLQSIIRVMRVLTTYHAELGELSQAVAYNLLALRLADKYAGLYTSLVQEIIATVSMRVAMDTTQYLLDHYELSPEEKADLLATYETLLPTDVATAYQQMYKGEYHTMTRLTNDFAIDELEFVGVDVRTLGNGIRNTL